LESIIAESVWFTIDLTLTPADEHVNSGAANLRGEDLILNLMMMMMMMMMVCSYELLKTSRELELSRYITVSLV